MSGLALLLNWGKQFLIWDGSGLCPNVFLLLAGGQVHFGNCLMFLQDTTSVCLLTTIGIFSMLALELLNIFASNFISTLGIWFYGMLDLNEGLSAYTWYALRMALALTFGFTSPGAVILDIPGRHSTSSGPRPPFSEAAPLCAAHDNEQESWPMLGYRPLPALVTSESMGMGFGIGNWAGSRGQRSGIGGWGLPLFRDRGAR